MEDRVSRTIVITDITPKTDCQLLLDTFKPFGYLNCVKVNKRLRNSKEVRIGFVTYDNREDATKVIEKYKNIMTLDGVKVGLSYAVKGTRKSFSGNNDNENVPRNKKTGESAPQKRNNEIKTKLFIRGIPENYNEDQICDLLGKCTIVVRNSEKDFCIAAFDSEETKKAVKDKLHDVEISPNHKLTMTDAHYGKNRNMAAKKRFIARKNGERSMG